MRRFRLVTINVRKTLVSLFMMLIIIGIPLTMVFGESVMSELDPGVLWKASLVPCSPEVCGGYPANEATLGLEKGDVAVMQSGLARIKLHRLKILSTGEIASNKTLEVWVGSFITYGFGGIGVGTITTDTHGNFNGTIDTGGGVPFAFASGATVSAGFILNDPGIRSELVTGFTVP